jgi:hypothetical protein
MSVYEIANQSDFENFLADPAYIYGRFINSFSLDNTFNFISVNKKIIVANEIFKVTSDFPTVDPDPIPDFPVEKDMYNDYYDAEYPPNNYPQYFPNMAPFIDENVIAGDKSEEDRTLASCWDDLGNDVFDDWGYFYLYDVASGKYYFPIISPQNQDDGIITIQTFTAFERTFTIKHGWARYGVFKFDISVNDNNAFKFGAYGNMGSDGDEVIEHLTQSYTLLSSNKTLYYVKEQEAGDQREILYSYFIPKNQNENNAIAYDLYHDSGDTNNSIMSKELTNGVLVYFAKTADVKNWVVTDVINTLD